MGNHSVDCEWCGEDMRGLMGVHGGDSYYCPQHPRQLKEVKQSPKINVCVCDDWEVQVRRINDPIVLQQIRSGVSVASDYYVKWGWCPWCGDKART